MPLIYVALVISVLGLLSLVLNIYLYRKLILYKSDYHKLIIKILSIIHYKDGDEIFISDADKYDRVVKLRSELVERKKKQ